MSGLMATIRQAASGKPATVTEEKTDTTGAITAPSLVEDEVIEDTAVEEDVEQVNEISKKLATSYYKGAKDEEERTKNDELESPRKKLNRKYGRRTALDRMIKREETEEADGEQIDELSKKTLGSYVAKASQSAADTAHELGSRREIAKDVDRFTNRNGWQHGWNDQQAAGANLKTSLKADNKSLDKLNNKAGSRLAGIGKAAKKLTGQARVNAKEEVMDELDLSVFTEEELADFVRLVELEESGVELNELSKKTLGSYVKKAGIDLTAHAVRLGMASSSGRSDKRAEKGVSKRIRGLYTASDKLAKEEVEMNETAAADSLKPAARSIADPKSKPEVISAVIGAMHAMKTDELIKWYTDSIATIGHEADSTPDASEKNKSSVAMKPSAAKEDVEKLFAGQELSEEFKKDAATLFEAAVAARVLEENLVLEEAYEAMLAESVEEIAEALADQVEAYLDAAAEQWIEENEVAIESTLRNELTEEFMTGLKNLFAEHYIDLPEERVDVVEELAARVEELEDLLDSQINENIEIKRALAEAEAEAEAEEALENAMEGMNLTQRERFKIMAETVEYDGDAAEFARKLDAIKTTYFTEGRSKIVETNIVDETFEGETAPEVVSNDPNINRYVQAIGRTVKQR